MEKRPEIIVLTGPESTGKTYLAENLAFVFKASWMPEYAREYIENLNRPYKYRDLEKIAKKQQAELLEIKKFDNKFVFLDTYLIITKIWFLEVFNKCPDWIDIELKEFDPCLFLLCNFDLPWEKDKVRENKHKREYLFNRYLMELEYYKFSYEIISGDRPNRLNLAVDIIQKFY